MGLGGYSLPFQQLHQSRSGSPQGIHLHHRLGRGIVGNQHRLQSPLGHIGLQERNQSIGMAVFIRIGSRFLQLSLCADGISQHTVDQGGSLGIAVIFLGKYHRLVDSGGFRDLVQLVDLVQSQMEDIPHHRVQIPEFPGQQLLQVKVQLAPVLRNSVAQPGSQSCIPGIQAVPLDVLLQHTVGPGPLLAAGDQRIQRRFPGAHQVSRGWPRK